MIMGYPNSGLLIKKILFHDFSLLFFFNNLNALVSFLIFGSKNLFCGSGIQSGIELWAAEGVFLIMDVYANADFLEISIYHRFWSLVFESRLGMDKILFFSTNTEIQRRRNKTPLSCLVQWPVFLATEIPPQKFLFYIQRTQTKVMPTKVAELGARRLSF